MKLKKYYAAMILLGMAMALIASFSISPAKAGETRRKLRIGVYESRAIAVAYAPSKFNNMKSWLFDLGAVEAYPG